jgi:hypothetical protein
LELEPLLLERNQRLERIGKRFGVIELEHGIPSAFAPGAAKVIVL